MQQQQQQQRPASAIEVIQPPNDTISCLSWSPKANFLAGSAWDGEVRVWEIDNQGKSAARTRDNYQSPVLSCCWDGDGTQVFSGNCNNKAMVLDVATGSSRQVGEHAAPIRSVKIYAAQRLLVTGSWDKTIKYWDGRQPQPVATINVPERVYCMDLRGDVLAIGTASGVIANPVAQPTQTGKQWIIGNNPHVQYQVRSLGIFIDSKGIAVGSIAGRVAVVHIHPPSVTFDFSFKCHRRQLEVYAVNSISFHPVFGSFATAGSDGSYHFWDKDNKRVLKKMDNVVSPLTILATEFNALGDIFAYAVGYDWSRGADYYESNPQMKKNAIYLCAVQQDDVKPRSTN